MNNLAFISSVVGSLAIPVTVLVALLIFRGPLAELLGRIISYEGLGQRVSFGRKLAGAEKSVSQAVAQAQEAAERPQIGDADAKQTVVDRAKIISTEQYPQDIDLEKHGFIGLAALAAVNPSFVVIKAWEDLEAELRKMVKTVFPDSKVVNPLRVLPDLVREGHVDKSFPNAVLELRDLRNNVAYGQHDPTAGEAVTYLESTQELMIISAMVRGRVGMQRELEGIRIQERSDRRQK